jgi:hypothetical protein
LRVDELLDHNKDYAFVPPNPANKFGFVEKATTTREIGPSFRSVCDVQPAEIRAFAR